MDLHGGAVSLAFGSRDRHGDFAATAMQYVPRWDAMRRELFVDGQIVKRFRLPAANQETVISAFEEEGWPPRIFDPLPPQGGMDPKQRLRETIKALNHSRLARIIRFCGDGTGQGILWEPVFDWR